MFYKKKKRYLNKFNYKIVKNKKKFNFFSKIFKIPLVRYNFMQNYPLVRSNRDFKSKNKGR